ncbi:MAG: hypothetical protein B7Y89_07345 [Novosphingobium sp. 32-60-15]|nr:MAG: hypothetical protein B7Y89_07345 [Novosphingobium sp. 32-60-15]
MPEKKQFLPAVFTDRQHESSQRDFRAFQRNQQKVNALLTQSLQRMAKRNWAQHIEQTVALRPGLAEERD